MDAQKRLQQLLDSKGWTAYRLAKKCNLSESTLANIFRRNTMPSISTLEAICEGFGISLAQFFFRERHGGTDAGAEGTV